MKRKYKVNTGREVIEREYNYIPVRYIIAVLIAIAEIAAIIGIVIALCYYVPYFYTLCAITTAACVIRICASDDNPDYKIPWLICVICIPIAGFMLYFMFYSRKLSKRYIKRIKEVQSFNYERDDEDILSEIAREDESAASQARMLSSISYSHVFRDTRQTYFPSGEAMWESMLRDLESAESFIFMEYFIIEEGVFWNSILDILKRKAKAGVDVRVMYDDIGCMSTLPGDYNKILEKDGIKSVIFSKLRGSADNEFNNRSHRKILVVDGKIGYTGGVNIADEYVNKTVRFGHWKDTAIRIEGEGVYELTKLFLSSFGLNSKDLPSIPENAYPECETMGAGGYLIPFGDGPKPIYKRNVAKCAIQNMIATATDYVYMTTPYLIIDNDLCADIERAALRRVDVRIVVPHVPDKKLVFAITRSFYSRLMDAGVKIYEYEPGFIHAKSYVADGKYAMIGTVNLDYRSLVHHFENGIWMYKTESIADIKADIDETVEKCIEITPEVLAKSINSRFLTPKVIHAIVRIFAPML
ncbi:MAG: cardiolipin synthase [Clostridia bacterium]|nr:cardiolipin synthase [Clostridia bacterium]